MKFKMKAALIASVAALALSGEANAITASSGGELFLLAYNSVSGSTFVATLDSIAATATAFTAADTSLNLASGTTATNWGSFAGETSFNTTNVTYSILGVDTTSAKVFTSASPDATIVNPGTTLMMKNLLTSAAGGGLNTWLTSFNSAVTGSGASAYYTTGTSSGDAVAFGTSWFSYLANINTAQNMGTYVNFDQLTKNGLNTNPLTATFIPATWTLNSNGLLSVAAVPEADPAMMILIGVGLIGVIARRRNLASHIA